MPGVRKRGEEIRDFIVLNISEYEKIAAITAEQFGISLPAVYKHINRLTAKNILVKKSGRFTFQSRRHTYVYSHNRTLSEDTAWQNALKPHFERLPDNVRRIWPY